MAPIRKGDGTPLEIPGVSEVRSGDGRVFFDDAIPDSVVTRPADNETFNDDRSWGVGIEVTEEWPEIGARISDNTSGATRAQIFDDDGQVIGETDISGKSAGDTFTVELDEKLVDGPMYSIELDAEGSDFDRGGLDADDVDLPYVSDDGNLEIVVGTGEGGDSFTGLYCVDEIGNVGFN